MNYMSLLVGCITFFLIGIFHIIVIKSEYFFSKKIWPLFLLLGTVFVVVSLLLKNNIMSVVMAIIGICFLWSIKELFEQEKRVKKGWYPKKGGK